MLAVDPSSPFTGGAILGDRVRMQDHALDAGVFIRSMASRGHLGGLAVAVPEAIRVLAAAGFPLVLVETVGVGQVEVEVAGATDTTIVVLNPKWGDAVQANKAGLLETADIFVINKADRPGAKETRRDLEQMLDLTALGDWRPPVLETTASTGDGVDALWEELTRHERHLAGARRARAQARGAPRARVPDRPGGPDPERGRPPQHRRRVRRAARRGRRAPARPLRRRGPPPQGRLRRRSHRRLTVHSDRPLDPDDRLLHPTRLQLGRSPRSPDPARPDGDAQRRERRAPDRSLARRPGRGRVRCAHGRLPVPRRTDGRHGVVARRAARATAWPS